MVNKNVLSCLLKDGREVDAVTLVGRLFHACATVTLCDPIWHVEFPVAVKAKLMLTAIHCLLYLLILSTIFVVHIEQSIRYVCVSVCLQNSKAILPVLKIFIHHLW